ncbi:MAG: DUF167 domain-containing protein [Sphingobacteriaceae bacterium]|nr:DUF167 domain-containing protein [Sphingobacteriaceae bacterium]
MIILKIKVKPSSFKDEIQMTNEGWIIKIKAKAIDGEANKYLINYLSNSFKIPKSSIILSKGNSSPFKTLLINVNEEEWNKIYIKLK